MNQKGQKYKEANKRVQKEMKNNIGRLDSYSM